MSGAIATAFENAAARERAAFIPYVTGGFPDPDTCLALMQALAESGADLIEVGLPFSDPLADGPTIQATSQRALEAGATPRSVLGLVERAAGLLDIPLVLMTYLNPVLAMGYQDFASAAAAAGAAGVIVPDLPPEEADPWRGAARDSGLDTIFLAAPPTPAERLRRILAASSGFVYYVSLTGVTGSGLELDPTLLAAVSAVRRAAQLPVAVGFGVARPEQARALARVADGVIVGSALMRLMLECRSPAQGLEQVRDLAGSLAGSLAKAAPDTPKGV